MHRRWISAVASGIALIGLVFGGILGNPEVARGDDAPRAETKSAPKADTSSGFPDSPEGALKSLILAMMTHNEKEVRRAILPTEDLKILIKGEPIPPEAVANFKDKFLSTMKIRRLKVGDQVKLPGGRVFDVKPSEVSAERAVIVEDGDSIPFRCHKIDGHWKVDATPLIAARKAADAVRKRNASKKRN